MRDLFYQFLLIREWKVKVFLRQNWRPNCRSWQVFLNKIEDYFFRRDRYFLRCGVKKRRYKENFKKDSRKTAVDRTLWRMEKKVGSKGRNFCFCATWDNLAEFSISRLLRILAKVTAAETCRIWAILFVAIPSLSEWYWLDFDHGKFQFSFSAACISQKYWSLEGNNPPKVVTFR